MLDVKQSETIRGWIEEASEERELEVRRSDLLTLATARFGEPDAGTRSRVASLEDATELQRLFQRAIRVESWTELFA